MVSWTITVPPTVAPATLLFALSVVTNSIDPKGDPEIVGEPYQATYNQTQYDSFLNVTSIDGVSFETHSYSYSDEQTDYHWASSDGWTVEATGTISDSGGGFITSSWDGQFTLIDAGGTTNATSSVETSTFQTTTNTTYPIQMSVETTTSQEAITASIVGTLFTTFTTTVTAATSQTETSVGSTTETTSTTRSYSLWNGTSGTRQTATVVIIGTNEVLYVPTTTYFGNMVTSAANSFTSGTQTILPKAFNSSGATISFGVVTQLAETVTTTQTCETTTGTTYTFTPISASLIPSTTSKSSTRWTTSSLSTGSFETTSVVGTPGAPYTALVSSTFAASRGTTSYVQAYSRIMSGTSLASTVSEVGVSADSYSATIMDTEYDIEAGRGTTYYSTHAAVTWFDTSPLQISSLLLPFPLVTAASFYEARTPLASLSSTARDVYAVGITFQKPTSVTMFAGQTAAVQEPTTWSYMSDSNTVSASAWSGGLSLTSFDTSSNTSTSGAWVAARTPNTTHDTYSQRNLALGAAPTGTAKVTRLPGYFWTSDSITSGTMSISETETASGAASRVASSAMPIFSVGQGLWFLTSIRNDTDTNIDGTAFL